MNDALATVPVRELPSASIVAGHAEARALTRHHSKSFYFASALLWGARRAAAYSLYAVCRGLDDAVDEVKDASVAKEGLAHAWSHVQDALAGRATRSGSNTLSAGVLAAFADSAQTFNFPSRPLRELVLGMEMDLSVSRYATWTELDVYCYRVAGTVGELMSHIFGFSTPAALEGAADLGRAMQLTNILRDVGEDLGRGRIYLPQDELAAFGVTEAQLRRGEVNANFIELMRFEISRARALYARAGRWVHALHGVSARATVRVMSSVYGGILDAIEANQFDVFRHRARLSFGQKLRRGTVAALTPSLAPGERAL